LLADGSPVSGSNYERIAWAKEALLQIAREPIGVGYNRSAFGVALKKIHLIWLRQHILIVEYWISPLPMVFLV
jgi:hypothetical protein